MTIIQDSKYKNKNIYYTMKNIYFFIKNYLNFSSQYLIYFIGFILTKKSPLTYFYHSIYNNLFIKNNKKKKLIDIFCNSQKICNRFRTFVKIYRWKKGKTS